jgi:rare lipoprotein A
MAIVESPLRTVKQIFQQSLLISAIALVCLPLTACIGPNIKGYKTKPYTLRGIRYHPMTPREALGHKEVGVASHYSEHFFIFPGKTATGEKLWPWTRVAAHKTLPIPCVVKVTNLKNGRSTKVRVNDRGPFIRGRMLDVTKPVADDLGFTRQGLTQVRIEVLSVGDGSYRMR